MREQKSEIGTKQPSTAQTQKFTLLHSVNIRVLRIQLDETRLPVQEKKYDARLKRTEKENGIDIK